MEPPSYMRSVVDRNVVTRRIPVYLVTRMLLDTKLIQIQFEHGLRQPRLSEVQNTRKLMYAGI
jgi:hypothetical protein